MGRLRNAEQQYDNIAAATREAEKQTVLLEQMLSEQRRTNELLQALAEAGNEDRHLTPEGEAESSDRGVDEVRGG